MNIQNNNGEEFFLENLNVESVFNIIERADYFFLYYIRQCMKTSEGEEGVYLSELAEKMNMSIVEASKAAKNLENKGYVTWKLDESKEKTYLLLTNKAVELMQSQRRKLLDAYQKITEGIRREDLEVTLLTLSKIKFLLEERVWMKQAHPLSGMR